MPNHVTNRLTINAEGERLGEILAAVQNDEYGEGSIDFGKIIPMPESLNIESGSDTLNGINLYLTALNPQSDYTVACVEKLSEDEFKMLKDRMSTPLMYGTYSGGLTSEARERATRYTDEKALLTLGKAAVENKLQYDATDWYDWSCSNWGTKWNAYGFECGEEDNRLVFDTAWSPPTPVIKRLSELYPEVRLEHAWADEDIGRNVGSVSYLGGEIVELILPAAQSREAYEMAFEIMGCAPEDYGLSLNEKAGEYEYKEKAAGGMEMT